MKTFEVTVDFIGTRAYTVTAKNEDEALAVAQKLGDDDANIRCLPDIFVEAVYVEEV
jgi:hypothetical protein